MAFNLSSGLRIPTFALLLLCLLFHINPPNYRTTPGFSFPNKLLKKKASSASVKVFTPTFVFSWPLQTSVHPCVLIYRGVLTPVIFRFPVSKRFFDCLVRAPVFLWKLTLFFLLPQTVPLPFSPLTNLCPRSLVSNPTVHLVANLIRCDLCPVLGPM